MKKLDITLRIAAAVVLFTPFYSGNFKAEPLEIKKSKIVYSVIQDTNPYLSAGLSMTKRLYIMDSDGHGKRKLAITGKINTNPVWSPDGAKIAFKSSKSKVTARTPLGIIPITREGDTETNLYIMNSNGQNIKKVTTKITDAITKYFWTPDGNNLIFSTIRRRLFDPRATNKIYSIRIDGRGQKILARNTSHFFSVSPKGEIVYCSTGPGRSDAFIMDLNGGNKVPILDSELEVSKPLFSPDGPKISFVSDEYGNASTGVVHRNGRYKILLSPPGGNCKTEDWVSNEILIIFCNSEDYSGLYTVNINDGEIRFISKRGFSAAAQSSGMVPNSYGEVYAKDRSKIAGQVEDGKKPQFNDQDKRKLDKELIEIVQKGKYDRRFQFLIKKGANIHQRDFLGRSLLIIAAATEESYFVGELLENNVDVNITDKNGKTALMEAAGIGSFKIVRLLLENNYANIADLNLKTKDGKNAIDFARENNFLWLAKMLEEYSQKGKFLNKDYETHHYLDKFQMEPIEYTYKLGRSYFEKEHVDRVIEMLDTGNHDTLRDVLDLIAVKGPQMKEVIHKLVTILDKIPYFLQDDLIDAIGAIGPDAKLVIPRLMKDLNRTQGTSINDYARVKAIGEIDPTQREAVSILVRKEMRELEKKGRSLMIVRNIEAMRLYGPNAEEAVPFLMEVIGSEVGNSTGITIQREAVETLGAIGQNAKDALPQLIEFMRWLHKHLESTKDETNSRHEIRYYELLKEILKAMYLIDTESKHLLDYLLFSLNFRDSDLQITVMRIFEDMGDVDPRIIPAMYKLIQDRKSSRHSRMVAVELIGKIAPAKADAEYLRKLLRVDNPYESQSAALASGFLGARANNLVSDIITTIRPIPQLSPEENSAQYYSSVTSIIALGKIGPGAKEAVPLLVDILNKEDDDYGWGQYKPFAATALGQIGDGSKEVLSALENNLDHRMPNVRSSAQIALSRVDPSYKLNTAKTVDELITFMKEYLYSSVQISYQLDDLLVMGDEAVRILPLLKMALRETKDYSEGRKDIIKAIKILENLRTKSGKEIATLAVGP